MQSEKFRVVTLYPKPPWVILHIVNHPPQLPRRMKYPLMIISRVLLPNTTPARKNANKLHRRLSFSIPVHSSGVLAATIHFFIHLRATALKPAHHRSNTLRKRLQHLNHQMHMVGHHLLRQHLQGEALPRIKLCQPTQHLTHPTSKGIEPHESRLRTLTLQYSKQRIPFLHRQRKMIDGPSLVVPSVFTVVPHGIDRPPLPLAFIHIHIPFAKL